LINPAYKCKESRVFAKAAAAEKSFIYPNNCFFYSVISLMKSYWIVLLTFRTCRIELDQLIAKQYSTDVCWSLHSHFFIGGSLRILIYRRKTGEFNEISFTKAPNTHID